MHEHNKAIVMNDEVNAGAGLNAIVHAIAAVQQNYEASHSGVAFDPTDLASTAIANPAIVAAVLLAWHEMNEPDADETLEFEADVNSRFAALGLGCETAAPVSVKPAADLSIFKRPPQERLSAETINLADHEVLQRVLAPVVPPERNPLIVEALLHRFRTFGQVIQAAAGDLITIEGLGEAGVIALKTVGAAALHMLRRAIDEAPRIRMWDDLIRYLIARLQHERIEVFFVMFLDQSSRVVADEELNRGTVNRVAAYPREIIRRCLDLDATSVILVHNHPTGTLEPSQGDLLFTRDVVRAASTMGIAVLDHIIVGGGEYFSFRAHKLLSQPFRDVYENSTESVLSGRAG
jgi:DNA repair protein RadC